MECNKEEAVRAREMAEKKMQVNDFAGAQRIALRAQQIYPELENILRILAVCKVHCASEQNFAQNELDWYGILQIEQTADESVIKKQYRKLALLLHPDKNKYCGAEAAFKFVGEAQRVLSNPKTRQMHDIKRRVSVRPTAVCSPRNKTHDEPNGKPPSSQKIHRGCQMPKNNDMSSQQQPQDSTQAKNKGDQGAFGQQDASGQSASASSKRPRRNSNPAPNAPCNMNQAKCSKTKGSARVNNKRKRSEFEETCESLDSESKKDANKDGDTGVNKGKNDQNVGSHGDRQHKKSKQQKISSPDKMETGSVASAASQPIFTKSVAADPSKVQNNLKQKKSVPLGRNEQKMNMRCPSNEDKIERGSAPAPKTESYDCADPDFHDFDKIREGKQFAAGQVWALYHPFDTMPRFYVIVKAVFRAQFKLRIVWLEPDPDDEIGVERGNSDFACTWGMFIEGTSEVIDNRFTFSHQMVYEKGSAKDRYKIYPRKGETWALFKNVHVNLASESACKGPSQFVLVEVLSGYVEGHGVSIVYLGKVKGFTSIYLPAVNEEGKTSFQVLPHEMSRFSHRIPSFKMSGEEKEGIPKGSLELDPAAIPHSIEVEYAPDILKVQTGLWKPASDYSNPVTATEPSMQNCSINEAHAPRSKCSRSESQDPIQGAAEKNKEITESEFYPFKANRSEEQFQVGRVWAICSDKGSPVYYGYIKSIISSPQFQLEVTRLMPCPDQDNRIKWHDKKMPFGCGNFKLSSGKPMVLPPDVFSHQLSHVSGAKRNVFVVYPRKGEVWALYKNWNVKMTFSEKKQFQYDIVEVLGGDVLTMEVLLLQRVDGFNSVFKGQVNNNNKSNMTSRIPRSELLQFSHRIPAFRLTNENQGALRGFWELDPAAIPQAIWCSK